MRERVVGGKLIKGQYYERSAPNNGILLGLLPFLFLPKKIPPIKISVLWLWVFPPPPHVPWAVVGALPVFDS